MIPVISYVFLAGYVAVALSIGLSAAVLFGLGAAMTLMTGRGVLFSGGRQLVIGFAAAAITFGIGRVVPAGRDLRDRSAPPEWVVCQCRGRRVQPTSQA